MNDEERAPERAGDLSLSPPSRNRKSAAELLQLYVQEHHHNPKSHKKILDLSNTWLDFEFSSLFSIIKLPPQIREVSFENCKVPEKCVAHIVQGLGRNIHLPELKTNDMTLISLTGKAVSKSKRDVAGYLCQMARQNYQRYLHQRDLLNQTESDARSRDVFRYFFDVSTQMVRSHQSFGMQVAFEEENDRNQITNALNFLWRIERQRIGVRLAEARLLDDVKKLFAQQRASRISVLHQFLSATLALLIQHEELRREWIKNRCIADIRHLHSLRSASFDTHSNLYQLRIRRYTTKKIGFYRQETQKRQFLIEEEIDTFAELRGNHFKRMTEMLNSVAQNEAELADAQKLERNTRYEEFRKRILGLEMERLDRASARQQASMNRLGIFEAEMKERGDITDAESKIYDLVNDVQATLRDAYRDRIRIDNQIRDAAVVHCFTPRVVLSSKKTTMNPIVAYRDTGFFTETDPQLSVSIEPVSSWYSEAETARDQLRVAFASARKTRQARIRSLKVSWQLINSVYSAMKMEMSFLPEPASAASKGAPPQLPHQLSQQQLSQQQLLLRLHKGCASATSPSGYAFTADLPDELRCLASPKTLDDCPDEQDRCPPILTRTIEQVVVDRCQCSLYTIQVDVCIRPFLGSSSVAGAVASDAITPFQLDDIRESFAVCPDVEKIGQLHAAEMNNERLKEMDEALSQQQHEASSSKRHSKNYLSTNPSSRASTAAATGRRPLSSASSIIGRSAGAPLKTSSPSSSSSFKFVPVTPHDALVHLYKNQSSPSERPVAASLVFDNISSLERVDEELRRCKLLALSRRDITKMTPVHYDPVTCPMETIMKELRMADLTPEELTHRMATTNAATSTTSLNLLRQEENETNEAFERRKEQVEREANETKTAEMEARLTVSRERALDIARAEIPVSFYALEWTFTLSFASGCSDEDTLAQVKIDANARMEEWRKDQERIAAEWKQMVEEYERQLEEQRILKERQAAAKAQRKRERLLAKQTKENEKLKEIQDQGGQNVVTDESSKPTTTTITTAKGYFDDNYTKQKEKEDDDEERDDDSYRHGHQASCFSFSSLQQAGPLATVPSTAASANLNQPTRPPFPPKPLVLAPPPHVDYAVSNKSSTRSSTFSMPIVLLQPSWFPKSYFRCFRQIGEGGGKALKLAKLGWQVSPVWQVLSGGPDQQDRESRSAMLFGKSTATKDPPPPLPQVICSHACVVTGSFRERAYTSFSGFALEVRIANIESGDRILLETGSRFWISAHGSLLKAGSTTNALAEVELGCFSALNEKPLHKMVFSDKEHVSEHDVCSILNMICFKNIQKRPSESIRVIEVRLSPPKIPGPAHRFEIDLRAPDSLPTLICPTKVVSCRIPQRQTFGNFFNNVPYFDLEMVPKLLFASTKKGKRAQINSPWFNPVALEELVDMSQSASSNPAAMLFPDVTVTCPDTCSFMGGKITFKFRTGMAADHLWLALPTQPILELSGFVFMKLLDDEMEMSFNRESTKNNVGSQPTTNNNSRSASRAASRRHSRVYAASAFQNLQQQQQQFFDLNTKRSHVASVSAYLDETSPSTVLPTRPKSGGSFSASATYKKFTCFTDDNVRSGQLFRFATAYVVTETKEIAEIGEISCAFFTEEELGLTSNDHVNDDDDHDEGAECVDELDNLAATHNEPAGSKSVRRENGDKVKETRENIREKIGVKEITIELTRSCDDDEGEGDDEVDYQNDDESCCSSSPASFVSNPLNSAASTGHNRRHRSASTVSFSQQKWQQQQQQLELRQHEQEQQDFITVGVIEKLVQSARYSTLTPYKTEFGGRDVNLFVAWNNSSKATPSQVERRTKRSTILESTVRVNILNSLLRPAIAPTQTATGAASAASVVAAIKSKKEAASSVAGKVPETLVDVSKGMTLVRPLELPEQPEDNAIIEARQFPVGSFLRFDLTGSFEFGDQLRIDKPEVPKDLVVADASAVAAAAGTKQKLASTLTISFVDAAPLPPPPTLPDLSRWKIEDLPHDAGLVNMWLQEIPKSVWEPLLRRSDLYSRRELDHSALPFADLPPCSDPECVEDYNSTRQLCVSKSGGIELESFWFSEWKKRCARRHAPPSMMGEGTKADWPWPPFSAFEEVYTCTNAEELLRGYGSGVFSDETAAAFDSFKKTTSFSGNKHSNSAPVMKLRGGLSAARANIPKAMVPKVSGVDFFKASAFSRWFFENPEDVYVYCIKRGPATIAKIYVCPRSVLFVTTSPKIQKQDLFAMSLMVSIGCTKPIPDSIRKLGRWTLFDGSSYSTQVVPIRVNPVPRPIGMQIKNAPRSRLYRFGSLPISRLNDELLVAPHHHRQRQQQQQQQDEENERCFNNNSLFLDKIRAIGSSATPTNRSVSERDVALGDGPFRPFSINELVINAPEPEFFTWKNGCFFSVDASSPSPEDAFGLLSISAQVEFFKEFLRSKNLDDDDDLPVSILAIVPFYDHFAPAALTDVNDGGEQKNSAAAGDNAEAISSSLDLLDLLQRLHEDAIGADVHAKTLSGSIGRTPDSVVYRLFEKQLQQAAAATGAAPTLSNPLPLPLPLPLLPGICKLRLLDVTAYQRSCSEPVTVLVDKKVPISATTQDLINETDYGYMDLESENKGNNNNNNNNIREEEIAPGYEDFADYFASVLHPDGTYRQNHPLIRRRIGSTPRDSSLSSSSFSLSWNDKERCPFNVNDDSNADDRHHRDHDEQERDFGIGNSKARSFDNPFKKSITSTVPDMGSNVGEKKKRTSKTASTKYLTYLDLVMDCCISQTDETVKRTGEESPALDLLVNEQQQEQNDRLPKSQSEVHDEDENGNDEKETEKNLPTTALEMLFSTWSESAQQHLEQRQYSQCLQLPSTLALLVASQREDMIALERSRRVEEDQDHHHQQQQQQQQQQRQQQHSFTNFLAKSVAVDIEKTGESRVTIDGDNNENSQNDTPLKSSLELLRRVRTQAKSPISSLDIVLEAKKETTSAREDHGFLDFVQNTQKEHERGESASSRGRTRTFPVLSFMRNLVVAEKTDASVQIANQDEGCSLSGHSHSRRSSSSPSRNVSSRNVDELDDDDAGENDEVHNGESNAPYTEGSALSSPSPSSSSSSSLSSDHSNSSSSSPSASPSAFDDFKNSASTATTTVTAAQVITKTKNSEKKASGVKFAPVSDSVLKSLPPREEFKIVKVPEVRYVPRYSAMDIVFQVCQEEREREHEEHQKRTVEAALALAATNGGDLYGKGHRIVGAGGKGAASSTRKRRESVAATLQQSFAASLQQQQSALAGPSISAIELLYSKIISDRIAKHSVELGFITPHKTRKGRFGASFLINLQEPESYRSKTHRESKAYVPVNTCLLNLLSSSFGWAPTKTDKWMPNEAVIGPRTFKVQLYDRYIPGISSASTKLRVAPPAFSLGAFDWSTSFIPSARVPVNVGVNAGKNIFTLPPALFGSAECFPVDSCCTFALFVADESQDRATVSVAPSLAAASMYSPWSMKKNPQTGIVFSANVAGRANASRARIVCENSFGVIVQVDGVLPTPQWLVEMSKIVVLSPENVEKKSNGGGGIMFWCIFSTGNVCNACKLLLQV